MNKNTVYILQKDYESPMCKVHKGVGYTAKQWLRYFPKLSEEDFDIKNDWFKPKEEPQWEILEFKSNDGNLLVLDGKKWKYRNDTNSISDIDFLIKNYAIHSVKRLSDGDVFSVGDSLDWMGKIESIEIDDRFNGGIAFINNSQKSCISTAKKAPKEEQVPIKVESIAFYTSFGEKQIRDTFAVNLSNNISEDKLQPIKKAIQSVINNDGLSEYFNKQPKLYSESELLQARRDAFYAGRSFDCWNVSSHQYAKFEDYINSLK